jgi:hypothetical protein
MAVEGVAGAVEPPAWRSLGSVCMHVGMYVCVRVRVCVYVCMYVCV